MTSNGTQPSEFIAEQSGERLDVFLAAQLHDTSRSQIARWIRTGLVTVNGQAVKAGHRLAADDIVRVTRSQEPLDQLQSLAMPLDVLYEDPYCIVINKPAGLVVHPAAGHRQDTLVNALIGQYPEMAALFDSTERNRRRGIVHRLDKDTSGALLVARTEDAWCALQRQFKARQVKKVYLALAYGRLNDLEGKIDAPIGRDPRNRKRMAVIPAGRTALTEYQVCQFLYDTREEYTLIEVHLHTGRTHQIRVHLAHIHHPVVGDPVYGRRKKTLSCPRQFLHARQLGFYCPFDGQWIEVESPLPDDLQQVLNRLQMVV
ncbi:MAG: RluA family pseudouridine synthase [Anaerolineae bacterium]|nr:RluA family pseudouridine synthase [Anaerolineae bacterium]